MEPGFDRPSLALRSEKELIASPIVIASGFARARDRTESRVVAMAAVGGWDGARGQVDERASGDRRGATRVSSRKKMQMHDD